MTKEIKINNGTAVFEWKNITNEPVLNYTTADGKNILRPSKMEVREHWIDCVDEDNALFEVYFHWELDCIIRWQRTAEKYLQNLINEEDYHNWNEKNYLD